MFTAKLFPVGDFTAVITLNLLSAQIINGVILVYEEHKSKCSDRDTYESRITLPNTGFLLRHLRIQIKFSTM